jgi:hypothetical protein
MKLHVTFDTISQESGADGDHDSGGYVDPAGYTCEPLSPEVADMGWTLREALDRFALSCDVVERSQDSVYGYPGCDFWLDSWLTDLPCSGEMIGATLAVHRPDGMTAATWARICRLLGCRA